MNALLLAALALSTPGFPAEVGVTGQGHASNPAWSADGQYLAFEMNSFGGQIDLYVAKLQNGNSLGAPTQVKLPGSSSSFGGGGGVAVAPTWHPQGRLIFEGSNKGGANRLFDWAPSSQGASELLTASMISGDLSWPTISADGNAVGFISDSTGQGDLYVWDRSSNQVDQALSSPFTESAPRYSSGEKIAYTRKNRGSEDVFTYDNGKSVPLVGGNGDQSRPIWSGEQVVYFSSERGEGHWDVVVSGGPGQKKTIARDVRLPDRSPPALSPDGQWVAYGLSDPEKGDRIAFSRVDGSATVEIKTGQVASGEPAVVEAGGRWWLAFTALPEAAAAWRRLHVIDITGKL